MSFEEAGPPTDHPITEDRARQLMSGDLADVYRDIMRKCVAPLYWHSRGSDGKRHVTNNGTVTFVRSDERVFGVTAAHVLKGYRDAKEAGEAVCQLGDMLFEPEVIDESERLDLATLVLPEVVLRIMDKSIVPVSLGKANENPQEGRGIMLCGYPGADRIEEADAINWGLVAVLGVARRVNASQITWTPNRSRHVPSGGIPELPPNKDLGGISGGPLIAFYEKAGSLLTYHSLAGIVVGARRDLENVVARRSTFIRPSGRLDPLY